MPKIMSIIEKETKGIYFLLGYYHQHHQFCEETLQE